MAKMLKALAVLPENPSSVLTTHNGSSQLFVIPVLGDPTSYSGL